MYTKLQSNFQVVKSSGSGGLPFYLEVPFFTNAPHIVEMIAMICVHTKDFSCRQMMFRTRGEESTLVQEVGGLASRIRLKGGRLIWEWQVGEEENDDDDDDDDEKRRSKVREED